MTIVVISNKPITFGSILSMEKSGNENVNFN